MAYYIEITVWLMFNLLSETMEARSWDDKFKVVKEKIIHNYSRYL